MPTYEYACTSCGERTEAKQSFDDPPLEECPVCGGRLRKLFSPVGIVFKGTGFYATDAKRGGAKAAPDSGKDASKDSSKDRGAKADKTKSSSEKEKSA